MIVRMWIAEGFIKAQKGKTVEEVGHSYLKELTLRCLVQSFYTNDAIGTKGVQVHRSLHGFLLSEAREAGFMEVHETQDDFIPSSVRRLSSYISDGGFTTFANKFSKLRSFLCWASDDYSATAGGSINTDKNLDDLKFLLRSKFLRVIEIKGLRIKELPAEICDMFHLRYLGVHSPGLKKLPPAIAKLINLQTLDIRGTAVKKIDPSFWNIKTLRHVLAQDLELPASSSIVQQLDGLQTLQGVRPAAEEEGRPAAEEEGDGLQTLQDVRPAAEEEGRPAAEEEGDGLQTLQGVRPAAEEGGDGLQTLQGVRPAAEKGWNQENCPLHKMTQLRTLCLHGIKGDTHGAELGAALLKMHLLRHLELYSSAPHDQFPPCIFKDRGLQNLESVKLLGRDAYYFPDDAAPNLRVLRPNLAWVDLKIVVPQPIEDEFKKLGVRGQWLKINTSYNSRKQ
jgi:hypothetical protein